MTCPDCDVLREYHSDERDRLEALMLAWIARGVLGEFFANELAAVLNGAEENKTRPDSKGRLHSADCTFAAPDVKFPVCTCGTWPAPHLNSVEEYK